MITAEEISRKFKNEYDEIFLVTNQLDTIRDLFRDNEFLKGKDNTMFEFTFKTYIERDNNIKESIGFSKRAYKRYFLEDKGFDEYYRLVLANVRIIEFEFFELFLGKKDNKKYLIIRK